VGERAGFDVEHYDLILNLSHPASGRIEGVAALRGSVAAGVQRIPLDLAGLDIESVEMDGAAVSYERRGAVLIVGPFSPMASDQTHTLRIAYGGAPRDGLFFGEDVNGDPAVFADNWPNRARWWFPSNDHPSDKASVRFEVTVPGDFGVIANGALVEKREDADGAVTWVWETDRDAPIPSYTMVIGVARFETRELGLAACGRAPVGLNPDGRSERCADVSVWALAGDGAYGVERFARAPDMLDYFAERIGPYPYEKLAHVESSTRFGGMENSSAIFYARSGWESRRMGEGVVAHETAHQWFGDAVSPASWFHLWVSEGFASYFGPLYFEARDGVEVFRGMMEQSRRTVLESDLSDRAIIDSTTNNLFELLNSNNYQKGSWVLHMLRGKLGDTVFFQGLGDYYADHLHGVADTDDVEAALEHASGEDLKGFFDQWVRSPGYPELNVEWAPEGEDLVLTVEQTQPASWPTFELSVEIEVEKADGSSQRATLTLSSRSKTLRVPGGGDAIDITIDPDVALLATWTVRRR